MAIIKNFKDYQSAKASVVTIGTFDGVHVGHQKIISKLVENATKNNLEPVILTFFPHPRVVLQKDANIKLINTLSERAELLKQHGIKHLVVKEFTEDFSKLSAADYVKQVLVDALNVKQIIIGYDHRFGKNRSANITDLKAFGKTYDFEVFEINAQDVDEVTVSSTKVRVALQNGYIVKANRYLGSCFSLFGTVVKGKGIGRELEFPTANIKIEENYKLIPKQGAYVVKSVIDGAEVYGMLNIGFNPTVNGTSQTIEVNYFNFQSDLYDKTIKVEFLYRLRDEFKFKSVEALKQQLKKDKIEAQKLIANHE